MRRLSGLFIALISAALSAADPVKKDAPPSYLVILQRDSMQRHDHTMWAPSRPLRKAIADMGMVGDMLPFDERITPEKLKQYNFVIIGLDQSDFKLSLSEKQAKNLAKLLSEYVSQGGGLYLTRNGGYQFGQDIAAMNRILEPFGASILDEQITDAANLAKGPFINCYWTGNIVKDHPVTAGVRGLFLPESHGVYKRYTDFASPIKVSPEWRILARTEKSGSSYHRPKGGKIHAVSKGSFSSEAPFLAARDFGKGRVVLFPVTAPMYWQDTHHPFFRDGKFFDGEYAGKPADGMKLVCNIMKFLSEPSAGKFGGFNSPYDFKSPPPPVLGGTGVNWEKVVPGKPYGKLHIGLIGAESNLSGGSGSPAEFIAAAKAAGYNFIAFAEDISKMDAEKYDRLKQICAEASAPGFRAYPGFRYTDETGCQWLVFSDRTAYPRKEWMSVKHPGRVINNNPLSRGWSWPPVVCLKSTLNPQEPYYKGNYKIIATHTYENGKLVDDSVQNYLRLNNNRFCLSPVAVHLIKSPAEVASARKNGMQTMVRWPDDDVIDAYTGRYCDYKGNYVWFRPTFVSSGPDIRTLEIINFGTSDLAVKGNDRYRIHFNVHADAGIREVIIRDGVKKNPFRRFLAGGAKDFEQSFDSFHLDRRSFVLEVTDMLGNKCFSQEAWTSINENEFGRCSDNINTMPRGKWWGTPDGKHNMRALEDYMVSRDFRYLGVPIFKTIGGEGTHPRVEHFKVLSSRYCQIIDCLINKHFPAKDSPNHDRNDDPLELKENRFYSGKARHIFFTGRQNSSLLTVVEGDFDILRSFVDQPKVATFIGRKDASNLTYTLVNGDVRELDMKKTAKPFTAKLPRTGFAAIHPNSFNGAPGFFALSDNLSFQVATPANPASYTLSGIIGNSGLTAFRKGQKLAYRYIAVCGTFNSEPGAEFMTDLRDGLGIGKPPAYTVTAKTGKAESIDGILNITPDKGAFRGRTSAADLPIDLPVIVRGLNPNWDAGIVYYGKNTIKTPVYSYNEYMERSVFITDVEHHDLLQHIPMLDDGDAYCQIETSRARDLFIGNMLHCSAPELILTVVDTAKGKRAFEAHNPTDKTISTTVFPTAGFTLLGDFSSDIVVKPGSSVKVELK